MFTRTFCACAGVAVLLCSVATQSAHAVALTEPVSPNAYADTLLSGTTVAARPELSGTVLQDVVTPFTFSGVSGSVQNRVVREDGTGTLDFYWKLNVSGSDNGAGVSAFRLANFGYGNIQDADFRTDGLGSVGPDKARLFNVASYPTGDVNFLFSAGLAPGQSSRFFFLHTNATQYSLSAQYDLLTTGSQQLSGTFSTFAPTVAVPEPSALGLTAAGLLCMGLLMRARHRV